MHYNNNNNNNDRLTAFDPGQPTECTNTMKIVELRVCNTWTTEAGTDLWLLQTISEISFISRQKRLVTPIEFTGTLQTNS